MNVNAVCNHNVATVHPSTGVVEAAKQMREAHVGDLIVVERRADRRVPVGIITDRDITVAVVAKGVSPNEVTVADAMSTELLTVHPDSGLGYALRDMRRAGVRRVPVVDADNDLIGVLSVDDVLDHLAVQLEHIADIVRMEQQAEVDRRP
jgi:CBS domain-containing protein